MDKLEKIKAFITNYGLLILFLLMIYCGGVFGVGVRCYQCSTDMEPPGQDYCGAFQGFNKSAYSPVDCSSFQAVTPGDFCMKVIQESPGLWGYWKTVHRRCASLSETGVQWGCDWWWDENGVQTEVCYCNSDGCNAASALYFTPTQIRQYKIITLTSLLLLPIIFHLL